MFSRCLLIFAYSLTAWNRGWASNAAEGSILFMKHEFSRITQVQLPKVVRRVRPTTTATTRRHPWPPVPAAARIEPRPPDPGSRRWWRSSWWAKFPTTRLPAPAWTPLTRCESNVVTFLWWYLNPGPSASQLLLSHFVPMLLRPVLLSEIKPMNPVCNLLLFTPFKLVCSSIKSSLLHN